MAGLGMSVARRALALVSLVVSAASLAGVDPPALPPGIFRDRPFLCRSAAFPIHRRVCEWARLQLRGGAPQGGSAGRAGSGAGGKASEAAAEVPILQRVNASAFNIVATLAGLVENMEGEEDPLAAANKKPASTGPAGVGATRIPFRERDIALKSFRARRAARGSLWWAQQVAERASVALRAAIAVEDAARVQWILLPETGPTAEMLDYSERRLALSVEGVQDGVAQLGALEADLADLPTALPVVTQLRILKQALAGQVGELHAALARLRDRAKRAAALSDGSHGGAGSSAGGGGAPEKTVRRRGAKAEAESESGYEAGSESDSLANYSSASCFERMRESSGAGKHDRILWGGNHWAAVDAQGRPVNPPPQATRC